jgi:uncharacterized membrane protein YbhN (UPF0104 family)
MRYNSHMSRKTLRTIIAVAVLIATVVVFTIYFRDHPEIIKSLESIPLTTIALLFGLYGLFMVSLAWIQRATLELCDIEMGRKESTLLVSYSSIINFFGPLQSGPAFRAAYLKKKYNVSLKKYALATLVYYGLYALFSAILIAAFVIGWGVVVLCLLAFVTAPLALRIKRFRTLKLKSVLHLAAATLSQVFILSVIYFVEVYSLMPHVTYVQTLVYTGAANFALFVSLTPGAIGFRESFLLFSQKLHDINGAIIAGASVIDRSVYILMLLVLAGIIFGFHANDYFKGVKIKQDKEAE